jgi:endonuclease/exonuclease/phosphatase family metal-dependent hydrolase
VSLTPKSTLKLLTYNIQAGARNLKEYVQSSLPSKREKRAGYSNLEKIAQVITDFDLVGLQEVDSGSFRTGYVDQVEYLARMAGFPHWLAQTNRKIGRWTKHGNAVLTKVSPIGQEAHKLPGVPGRGALFLLLGEGDEQLVVVTAHLALGRVSRTKQLEMIEALVSDYKHVIIMGDMNCSPSRLVTLRNAGFVSVATKLPTFPSWQPMRSLDQVWVSPSIQVNNVEVLPYELSDHLPVAVEVTLPFALKVERV